jgi:outer membrane protein assembly factor BamE
MKKILISALIPIALLAGGCSHWEDVSLVHVPVIEQGNIVTPEMVALLEPGMTKRQVRFALGSPMLVDVFHEQRWEYLLTIKRRNEPMEIKRFSVFFDGDRLNHYEGEIPPAENVESTFEKREILVSVPDYEGDLGLLDRFFRFLGFKDDI